MVSTTISLKLDGTEYILSNLVRVNSIEFSVITTFSTRATRSKARHVNRKMPIDGITISGFIKDVANFFPFFKKVRELQVRKPTENEFNITIDGTNVYSENVGVPNLTGSWLNISKPKMDVTITLVAQDAL